MPGGNLQSDVADKLLEVVTRHSRFLARADFDQHADFPASVNISRDHAVAADFDPFAAGKFDVLADFGDLRHAVRFNVGSRIERELFGELVAKSAEAFVARDKICLAIDLHENADA